MIKRDPPKMWRGQVVKKGRWVVRIPTLRFRDWFFLCGGDRRPVVHRYPFLWIGDPLYYPCRKESFHVASEDLTFATDIAIGYCKRENKVKP